MRLIDTETLDLTTFEVLSPAPPYVILSHVWGDDESSYEDFSNSPRERNGGPGHQKIVASCGVAKQLGYRYLWADTVCIDKKRGDQELSEAINAMYQWYQQAAVCVAYLDDVTEARVDPASLQQFRSSKWFKRGWTLQELIAPRYLVFFTRGWDRLFALKEQSELVSEITGIPDLGRDGVFEPYQYTVAQRMSWASHRCTTMEEDRAYSLMGLFGINMDIRYGEGNKTFARLQEEIFRTTHDLSIFAWEHQRSDLAAGNISALFAPSLESFSGSGNIVAPSRPLRKLGHPLTVDGREVCFYLERGLQAETPEREDGCEVYFYLERWLQEETPERANPSGRSVRLLNCVDNNKPDQVIGLNIRGTTYGGNIVELRPMSDESGRVAFSRLNRRPRKQ